MVIQGVVSYRLRDDGSLEGQWIAMRDGDTDGKLGTEVAVPIGSPVGDRQFAGEYHVELRGPDGRRAYSGTLKINPVGPSYLLYWTPGEAYTMVFAGLGMVTKSGELAAAYWLVE
jgi:hypothetical protein